MPSLDMFTVVFGQTLISAICAIVAYLLWRNNRARYDGIGFWFADYALQTVCVGLIMLRGHIPDLISIVVANGLGMTGMLLLYEGLLKFFGVRQKLDKANLAALLLFLASMYYYGVVAPSLSHRNLAFNLALGYFCSRSAWFLARGLPAELGRLGRAAMHSLLAFCAVCLARLGYMLFGEPPADFMLSRSPDAYFILAYSALLVMLTYGLFLLVNRRLLAETKADYEGRMEAEKALSGALRVAKLGTWRWDIKTGKLSWSEEMYSIFGLDKGGFSGDLGAVVAAAIYPEDRAAVEASNRKVAEEGLPAPLDYRVVWPDGSLHWVHAESSELLRDEAGLPAALKGYAQDITALKKSEEKFSLVFRTAPYAITITAMEDARMLEVNEAFSAITGYSREEAVGRTSLELGLWRDPADREAVIAGLLSGPVLNRETAFRRKNGSLFEAEFSSEILELDGRKILISSIRDISETKRAEAAIQAAQRLESLGTLAGGIAHDFNNLLTGITGNLSLIRGAAAAGKDVGELTSEAESACSAARALARQLLTFSTGGEPVRSPLGLPALVKDAVAFSLRGSGTRYSVSGGEGLVVLADREQLFQVFQNLALNASQAMAGGGEVKVSINPEPVRGGGAAGLPAGDQAVIRVSDSGGGMTPEVLRRIFEPYYSTKGQGRGLGLAVCRSVVAKHGGRIEASSEPAKGSVFTVYLPLTVAKPAAIGQAAQQAMGSGSGRVLIMDDEEIVWKALRRMLGALGYEAEVVGDGEAALAAWADADRAGRPFRAAIMDLTIPGGMGGAEAVKLLKGKFPAAKVLVSSGYAEDPVMADYSARGFDGALSKPYRVEDLAAVLDKLLR